MIDAQDICWFAGLMEGEGCFSVVREKSISIHLSMTDKDVVDRVAALFPWGTRQQYQPIKGKRVYRWISSKRAETAGLMMTLLPLMGERRRAKIMECLEFWKKLPPIRWHSPFCKRGHPKTPDNVYVHKQGKYMHRSCKICRREAVRRYACSKVSFIC